MERSSANIRERCMAVKDVVQRNYTMLALWEAGSEATKRKLGLKEIGGK